MTKHPTEPPSANLPDKPKKAKTVAKAASNNLPAAAPVAEHARKVGVSAGVDRGKVAFTAESEAVSAIDRATGGLFGRWAARAQGARRREEIAEHYKTLEFELQERARLLKGAGGIGTEAAERFIANELRRQFNLDCVEMEAVE